MCKVEDDFPPLAEKIRQARALVVGGYCPYGSIDGFTKAFLYGETCSMSALSWVSGKNVKVTPDKFCNVEDQTEVMEQARELGGEIGRRLKGQLAI